MKFFKMYFDSPNGGGCFVGTKPELQKVAGWFSENRKSLRVHNPVEITEDRMKWMLSPESTLPRGGRSAEPASEFDFSCS